MGDKMGDMIILGILNWRIQYHQFFINHYRKTIQNLENKGYELTALKVTKNSSKLDIHCFQKMISTKRIEMWQNHHQILKYS